MVQQIFTDEDSNVDSVAVTHGGGKVELIVGDTADDFDGATVTAYAKFNGMDNYAPLDGGTWTAAAIKILEVMRPCSIKLAITGAGAGTSINAWI